jgi:probable rRNA maturation factor
VSVCDARGLPLRVPGLAGWLARVAPARARGALTIALVGDARMRTLNRTWRQVDRATDVLSFPAEERAEAQERKVAAAGQRAAAGGSREPEAWPPHLGDIVIATGVAARQAREAGHGEAVEWRVLALHGLLHLLGYDHERDAGQMARVEARLRRRGGLAAGLIERAPDPTRPGRRRA